MSTAKLAQSPPHYELIESFFLEILKLNPQVRCALEVSLDLSFLSAFMCNVREGGLPIFCFDASHSKHPDYSGKHFVLLKKLATNKFITLCYAIAPTEDIMYLSWFFYACVKSGVDLSSGVMFVDRGHARSAISLLAKFLNIRVNLKYCTIHIIRNFATKFSFKETDVNVRVAIFRLQKSSSAAEYILHGSAIEDEFGTEAMNYLCKNIHPTNWVVFANNKNGNEEMKKLPEWVGSEDPNKEGWPAPLFGCRSTNGAEGVNNALIHNDSRSCLPFESLNIVFKSWSRYEVERALLCRKFSNMDGDFVECTRNIVNDQLELSRKYECQIMSMTLNEISHLTVTSGNSLHRYVVDTLKRQCSCSFFQQYELPCPHVFAAKAFCMRERYPFPHLSDYANTEYLRKSFISSLSTTSICLPTTDFIKIHEIKAPAYKRSTGRPSKKARHTSRSERSKLTVKTAKFCSRCKNFGHNTRTCTVLNPGLSTVNKANSSYGTTYVGFDVSIFSSKIFENVSEVNTDTFKSSLESHSFCDTFEKEDSDVISVSYSLLSTHEVESSVVNGLFIIFYVIILYHYSLFVYFSEKKFRFPKINCEKCNYPLLSCGDCTYYENCLDLQFWWFHETINTVGYLLKHITHKEDIFFLDGSFLSNEEKIIPQPIKKSCEVLTVLHHHNHFAAVKVTISNESISEIIIYDGKRCNGVLFWKNGLRCLLKKIGHSYLNLHKARKYSITDFSGVDFILQPNDDNSNCGPIAAMVLIHKFLPEKCDYNMSVNQFRVFVIDNLLEMLDSISTI